MEDRQVEGASQKQWGYLHPTPRPIAKSLFFFSDRSRLFMTSVRFLLGSSVAVGFEEDEVFVWLECWDLVVDFDVVLRVFVTDEDVD